MRFLPIAACALLLVASSSFLACGNGEEIAAFSIEVAPGQMDDSIEGRDACSS